MTRVVIHIDRLVLTAVNRRDAAAITAAFESELERLLSAPHASASASAMSNRKRVDVGSVRVASAGGAELGAAVAARIARSLM